MAERDNNIIHMKKYIDQYESKKGKKRERRDSDSTYDQESQYEKEFGSPFHKYDYPGSPSYDLNKDIFWLIYE